MPVLNAVQNSKLLVLGDLWKFLFQQGLDLIYLRWTSHSSCPESHSSVNCWRLKMTSHSGYQSLQVTVVTPSLVLLWNVEGLRWPVTLITLSHKWSQIVSLVTHGPKWSHWFVSRLIHNLVGWNWSQRMTSHSSYSESEVVTNCHIDHKWSHWSVSRFINNLFVWDEIEATCAPWG